MNLIQQFIRRVHQCIHQWSGSSSLHSRCTHLARQWPDHRSVDCSQINHRSLAQINHRSTTDQRQDPDHEGMDHGSWLQINPRSLVHPLRHQLQPQVAMMAMMAMAMAMAMPMKMPRHVCSDCITASWSREYGVDPQLEKSTASDGRCTHHRSGN